MWAGKWAGGRRRHKKTMYIGKELEAGPAGYGAIPGRQVSSGKRLQAVFLAAAGLPRVGAQVSLVRYRQLVAVAVPDCDAGSGRLAEGLQHFTPAVRLDPAPYYPSLGDLYEALEGLEAALLRELTWRACCAERRILLCHLPQSPHGRGLCGEQARLVAKLAQTAKEASREVCVTPPALMAKAEGEVHLAMSLMIEAEQMFAADRALELAGRIVGAHHMKLTVSPPGPIESFPIRDMPIA